MFYNRQDDDSDGGEEEKEGNEDDGPSDDEQNEEEKPIVKLVQSKLHMHKITVDENKRLDVGDRQLPSRVAVKKWNFGGVHFLLIDTIFIMHFMFCIVFPNMFHSMFLQCLDC